MATDMQVYGVDVKRQSAMGVFGMMLITLGLYAFWWTHRVNREMRYFGRVYNDPELSGVNPALSAVAVIIPIVNLVGLHRIGKRIQRVQQLTGRGVDYSMGLHWILALFTGLWWMYSQHALSSLYNWIHQANNAPVAPQAPVVPASPIPAGMTPPSAPGGSGGPFVG